VDSSLLVAKAISVAGIEPSTYTIGFRWNYSSHGREFDRDLQSARRMRGRFELDYQEMILEPSIVSILPKVVESLEEPLNDPAAICSYLICQAAASRFKVLISGQGGDELFGGYPVYQGGWAASQLQAKLPSALGAMLHGASRAMPYSVGGRELRAGHRMRKLFSAIARPWPEPFFLLRSAFSERELEEVLSAELRSRQAPAFARHLDHFAAVRESDRFQQMMYLDTKTYLPADNLAYSDKTSMAHSVELRVPLLGAEMLRLAAQLPSRYKARFGEGKVLLKKVASRHLPTAIVQRKKAGFGLPLRDWFQHELQPMAFELLGEERLRAQGLFEPSVPSRWLREHRERSADHSMKLFSLVSFQLWWERFRCT